jgi:uncharacterized membrane protein YphA (DoxX/SURF4 family)
MDNSMAQPAWKSGASAVTAYLLGLLFLVAGLWKLTDPLSAAMRMNQALVPAALSLAAAIGFGISEVFAATLLFIPRFRRWGAWITGLLLIAFMGYMAINYAALQGADCSCFPWLKRAVGPGFFIGDLIMLIFAVAAGWWARRSEGLRGAAIVLAAVVVFAGVSYAWVQSRLSGTKAPDSVTVDGKPLSLQQGRFVVFFFDPECMHCFHAAQTLSKHKWVDTKILCVPTRVPQFAGQFMNDTGLKCQVTNDLAPLKAVFPFGDPPYGVALEYGRLKAPIPMFDEKEPYATLKALGFVE